MACVIGGVVYWLCNILEVGALASPILSALSVMATRMGAMKYNIGLPLLTKYEDGEKKAKG